MHLVVEINSRQFEVHIKPSKRTQNLYNQLVTFSSKVESSKQETTATSEQAKTDKIDIATELEKFHGLVQKGILTQEEFEAQKKKLLS